MSIYFSITFITNSMGEGAVILNGIVRRRRSTKSEFLIILESIIKEDLFVRKEKRKDTDKNGGNQKRALEESFCFENLSIVTKCTLSAQVFPKCRHIKTKNLSEYTRVHYKFFSFDEVIITMELAGFGMDSEMEKKRIRCNNMS